jgi:exo-1,4-beta-D-glucosaminidase
LSRTYFVKLTLNDAAGNLVSSNFYWLSTQPDVFDWQANDYPYAQLQTYADLTGLQALPPAQVAVTWNSHRAGSDQVEHIVVRNVSSALAFLVHLTVLKGKNGDDIAPVCWTDNYFELLPGEERQITATYSQALLGGAPSYIQVDGWNVTASSQ